jgi:hypothetical protein
MLAPVRWRFEWLPPKAPGTVAANACDLWSAIIIMGLNPSSPPLSPSVHARSLLRPSAAPWRTASSIVRIICEEFALIHCETEPASIAET